jgi:hypothetical protein
MSLSTELNEEDRKRINACDYYLQSKKIMESFERYRPIEVGEVYSVSYLSHDNKPVYIKRSGSSSQKDKFLVIHKDQGFVFAKRINSGGSLSKEVICLTIRFPSPDYCLELDADQAESIIFQNEEAFDPFKQGKDLSKRKNKARRINGTKKTVFEFLSDAINFAKNLKAGDVIYDSGTTFGEGIVEWTVKSVTVTPVDKTPQRDWQGRVVAYGATDADQKHNRYKLDDVVVVYLEAQNEMPLSRRWVNKNRSVTFIDFLECSERHRDYYLTKPVSVDEI